MLYNVAAQAHLTSCGQQHFPTLLQYIDGLDIEGISNIHIMTQLLLSYTVGIDPEVPMVPDLLTDPDGERQLTGLTDAIQRIDNSTYLYVLSYRHTV